jgi:hypothetical protein
MRHYYEELIPALAEYAATEFQYADLAHPQLLGVEYGKEDGEPDQTVAPYSIPEYLQNGVHILGSTCILNLGLS